MEHGGDEKFVSRSGSPATAAAASSTSSPTLTSLNGGGITKMGLSSAQDKRPPGPKTSISLPSLSNNSSVINSLQPMKKHKKPSSFTIYDSSGKAIKSHSTSEVPVEPAIKTEKPSTEPEIEVKKEPLEKDTKSLPKEEDKENFSTKSSRKSSVSEKGEPHLARATPDTAAETALSDMDTDMEDSIPLPSRRTRRLHRLMRHSNSGDDSGEDTEKEFSGSRKLVKRRSPSNSSKQNSAEPRKVSGKSGKDASGRSLLQRVCAKGNFAEAKELIEKGANVNEADYAGNTPLHEAALEGYTAIVELLLDNDADIDAQSGHIDKDTPLIDAASNLHYEAVKVLLSRGANPCLVNSQGDSALDAVERERDLNELEEDDLIKVRKLKKLLAQSAREFKKKMAKGQHTGTGTGTDSEKEDNVRRQNQNTFYDLFSREGRSEIYTKVAENDVTFVLNYVSNLAGSKISPDLLSLAAKHGHTDIASLLIAFGANVNYADKNGVTPLMYAVGKDHLSMVRLLLENKANPLLRDRRGRTVLEIIKESYIADDEEFKLLENAAANFNSNDGSGSPGTKRKGLKRRRTEDESREPSVGSSFENADDGENEAGDEGEDYDDKMKIDKHKMKKKKPESILNSKKLKKKKSSESLDNSNSSSSSPARSTVPTPVTKVPAPVVKTEADSPVAKEPIEQEKKETEKVAITPPLTPEEIEAKKQREIEAKKAREALEQQRLERKKARQQQIAKSIAELERKRQEEKREAELQEQERRKKEEEETARKQQEEEQRAKLEADRQDTEKKKLIRSYYPYGMQQAKFDSVPDATQAARYLPVYFIARGEQKFVLDLQVMLLCGTSDFYASYPNIERKQLTPLEKTRMWNLLWPMIGSFIRNSKSFEVDQLQKAYENEEKNFQELIVNWIKLDDFESIMKEEKYQEVARLLDGSGYCEVANFEESKVSPNDNVFFKKSESAKDSSLQNESIPPLRFGAKAQKVLRMVNKRLW